MADVPDQPVARRVKYIVQGHGQLDDAKAGAEMAAGYRDRVDRLLTQFIGDLRQLLDAQVSQVFRRAQLVEKRRLARLGHRHSLGMDFGHDLAENKANYRDLPH